MHEVLKFVGEGTQKQAFAPITLHHYPDSQKSRSSYLPLLELSVKENPNDDRSMHYLGREYMFYGKYEKAIEYFQKAGKVGTPFCDEKYRIAWCYRELKKFKEAYQIYLEIADIHRKNGYDVEAEQALGYAKEIENKIKESHLL